MKPNRKITPDDLAAARRLRALWENKRGAIRAQGGQLTQEEAGLEMGWSQSAVSQYLLGRVALGIAATLKFARYFRVHPNDIRPETEFHIGDLADVEDSLLEHLNDYASLDEDGRALVESLIRQLKKTG